MPERHVEAVTSGWAATPAVGAVPAQVAPDSSAPNNGVPDNGAPDKGGRDSSAPDSGVSDSGAPGQAGGGQADDGAELVIGLGEAHPSGHGLLRLRLTLEGDLITAADPVIGYVHRGAEKLFEARDYRQIIVLANRHDWLGAFASELGVVLAAERLAGIEVPPRGVWARTLLAELNRVLSHLAFLASYPPELVADGAEGTGPDESASAAEGAEVARSAAAAAQARELLQTIMEEISGGRMHYMFNRVGGLKEELPAGWLGRVGAAAAEVRAALPVIGAVVRGNAAFRARTRQVGCSARSRCCSTG